jgi:hypothetical protein
MSIYRMPVGFGPSVGPRQGPEGRRFNGDLSRATVLSLEYLTDPGALQALLPEDYKVGAEPLVTVKVHHNHSLAWFAGRGYNYIEILFRAVFEGQQDRCEGDFVAVMWESHADPIIVGRDEVGHPKIFADIPEPTVDDSATTYHASWFDYEFCRVAFHGLALGDWPAQDVEDEVRGKPPTTGLAGLPRLNYKYIPNAADLEKADVAYTVMFPAGLYENYVVDSWRGSATVEFEHATWEQLPTMYPIVNKMADLPVLEYREASMIRTVRSFNDLRDVARILR